MVTAVSIPSFPMLEYEVEGPVRKFTPVALTLPVVVPTGTAVGTGVGVMPAGVGVGVIPAGVGEGVAVLVTLTKLA